MKLLFWTSLIFLAYIYLFYPLAIVIIARFKNKPVRKGDITPSVSLVIAAYNEEKHMVKKIENTLSLDYPREKLEIIVVSDGSTDSTDDIVRGYCDQGVRLISLKTRMGKTQAQNKAARVAVGDILFFSDATAIHPPDVIRKLVRNFSDPEVGCVGGYVTFRDLNKSMTGKGFRIRILYETYFRGKQSDIQSRFGAPGCMYAVRRELYQPVRPDLVTELVVPLRLLDKGLRTVYEPEALAMVDRSTSARGEFARRARMSLQGLRLLLHMRHIGNPFRCGFLVASLYIHRMIRWLSPVFLLLLLFTSLSFMNHQVYRIAFLLQVIFYALAVVTYILDSKKYKLHLLAPILYFALVNAAYLVGLIRLLQGETGQTWEPVKR